MTDTEEVEWGRQSSRPGQESRQSNMESERRVTATKEVGVETQLDEYG